MATRIVLLPAGLTDWDVDERIQGDLQVPLSDQGRAQVEAKIDELRALKPKLIYSAETLSAAQTAEVLGERMKLRTKTIPKLNEVGFGMWQGLLIDEVKNRHPKVYKRWLDNPPSVCPPDGEPVSDAKQRISDAIRAITKKHDGETVVVVCPKAASTLAKSVLGGLPAQKLLNGRATDGAWEVFETGE